MVTPKWDALHTRTTDSGSQRVFQVGPGTPRLLAGAGISRVPGAGGREIPSRGSGGVSPGLRPLHLRQRRRPRRRGCRQPGAPSYVSAVRPKEGVSEKRGGSDPENHPRVILHSLEGHLRVKPSSDPPFLGTPLGHGGSIKTTHYVWHNTHKATLSQETTTQQDIAYIP